MKRSLSALAVLLWATAANFAQDVSGIKTANLVDADLNLVTQHDPEVERASFDLLPGYEVNLFATEPMLANPVQMVWDPRGRLWVACSWAYPQLKPGAVANDKIIILEDTDGDGTADKSTVFADGLYIPTGIELANGGLLRVAGARFALLERYEWRRCGRSPRWPKARWWRRSAPSIPTRKV